MSANDTSAAAKPPTATVVKSWTPTHGMENAGNPRGRGPSTETLARVSRSKTCTIAVAPATARRMPGRPLKVLIEKITASVAAPQREFGPIHPSASDLDGDRPDARNGPAFFDFDARLTHENRERDSIHVSVTDRLREKLGDEPQTHDAGKGANRAGNDGHHPGKRDGAIDISSRERSRYAQNDGGQRGVGPEHQDTARAEERICQKGYDGRVEAIDTWKARGDGIRDPNRCQGRRENQPGS